MPNEKVISSSALINLFRQCLADNWGYIWGTAGDLWTADDQKALEKTTDSDRAQGRKYGAKWIGHRVADCSGLFKWAFNKLGGYMYHGSNTMYLKYCVNKGELKKGKRADGAALKPGTAVFVWNGKTYSHVGLFVGDGLVIEAESTQKGVTTSKVTATKWTYWGELKGVDYSAKTGSSPPSDPVPDKEPVQTLPTLKRGSKGEYVTLLQTKLKNKGYDLGAYGVDGDFGKATEAAVRAFQMDAGIAVDGVVGKNTWAALDKNIQAVLYTVSIPHLTEADADAMVKAYKGAYKEPERG